MKTNQITEDLIEGAIALAAFILFVSSSIFYISSISHGLEYLGFGEFISFASFPLAYFPIFGVALSMIGCITTWRNCWIHAIGIPLSITLGLIGAINVSYWSWIPAIFLFVGPLIAITIVTTATGIYFQPTAWEKAGTLEEFSTIHNHHSGEA